MNALKLAWNVLAIAGAWLLSPVGMSLLIVVIALTHHGTTLSGNALNIEQIEEG